MNPETVSVNDVRFFTEALGLAQTALVEGEFPVVTAQAQSLDREMRSTMLKSIPFGIFPARYRTSIVRG